jgi:hypothetical protein
VAFLSVINLVGFVVVRWRVATVGLDTGSLFS